MPASPSYSALGQLWYASGMAESPRLLQHRQRRQVRLDKALAGNAWTWDRERRVLTHRRPSSRAYGGGKTGVYEVSLERMPDAASVLDWIAQVSRKAWATPAVVGDLVRLLDALLHLQANYCGNAMGGAGLPAGAETYLVELEGR